MDYSLNTSIIDQFGAIRNAVADGKSHRFFLGIDLDLASCALAVIIDGGTPSYFGKHTRQNVVELVGELRRRDHEVATVQEACGMGYEFHRQLEAPGARSLVVAPESGGCRKTDKTDARKLARKLYDKLVNGAKDALRCVRVPSPEEHRRRAVSRHRHHLLKEVKRLASTGLSLLHDHGFLEVSRRWWGPRNWSKLRAQLQSTGSASWLVEILQPVQETILRLERRQQELAEVVVATNLGDPGQHQGMAPTPKGFGELTRAEARAEVSDWNRFNNRKQVGSLGGLCPSEYSSGAIRNQGPIDRMGNPRLRAMFVEAAWRMVRWQPDYRGVRKFAHVLAKGAMATKAARKKAVVALARMLMIDLWRIETGRCSPAQLGLN